MTTTIMKNRIIIIIIILLMAVAGYLIFTFLQPENSIPKTPRGGAIEGSAVEESSAGL
jgi:flagellar basal body-associated protein FliL